MINNETTFGFFVITFEWVGGLIEKCWNRWHADTFRHHVINFEGYQQEFRLGQHWGMGNAVNDSAPF